MTRARAVAQAAVDNVWPTLAKRVVTFVDVSLFLAAGVSYMALRDRATIAEAAVVTAQQRLTSQEIATAGLRTEVAAQGGNVTRRQAQRERDAQIGQRVNDLREDIQRVSAELRGDIQRVNGRLDQMMTPPTRMVPR